jgi:predicted RNase H-like HicB family nuclease
MSSRSKPSSAKKTATRKVDSAFSPAIIRKARQIAHQYKLTIESSESLGYVGSSIEIPTVFADGDTPDKCYEATQEALSIAVGTMLEAGQIPPQPAAFMKRTTQVNVRLTQEEKSMIAAAAARSGFKGLADFIRSTILDRVIFSR